MAKGRCDDVDKQTMQRVLIQWKPALIRALLARAEELGHADEMQRAIDSILRDYAETHEKSLVCLWADGVLSGNWPWLKI